MNSKDEDFNNFTVNYDKIINSNEHLAVTRLLAQRMLTNPYFTVGEFLKSLSTSDLELLQDVAECAIQPDDGSEMDDRIGDLILIAQMLAEGEGTAYGMNIDEVFARSNQFATFLSLESLFRKGLIKLHRENISFGADAGHKIVAERIDDESN